MSSLALADQAINATVTTDPALHALLPAAIQSSGVVHVATDAHHLPCDGMEDDNKTFTGWEEDFRQALGKKLGVKIDPVSINFDGLIPGVQSGRYDMAMQCISDTPARQQQVDFVDMSISVNGVFAMKDSKVTADPLTLCGLKSGAQAGTTYGDTVKNLLSPNCVAHGKPPISAADFGSQDATLLALLSGRVDFIVNDASSENFIAAHSPKPIKVVVPEILPKHSDGIVVKKGNDALSKALLAGTEALLKDGTYQKIMEKWHLTAIILKKPGINLETASAK
jgi:polar amino acid transport system substrate-binding protein